MDQTTLDRIRDDLEAERKELVVQLQDIGINPETGDPKDVEFDHGFADSGQATAEKARLLSVAGTLFETLREVDAALQRMAGGHFGRCEQCGDEIPLERLEARPQARLCMRCSAPHR